MLHQLCRLAIPIIQRKKEKWNTSIVSEAYPIMELHESYTEKLYARLDQLETGQLELKCVRFQYKGLADLKLKLDQEPWHRPNGLDQAQMVYFAHDLLFYLMVNSLLDQATYLFGAYLTNEERVSYSGLYHRIRQSSHKILKVYLKHLPPTPWLEHLFQRDEPKYFSEWQKLQKALKNKIIPSVLLNLLHEKAAQLNVLPVNSEEELKKLVQVERMNQYLERFIRNQQWTVLRDLIHFCLSDCYVSGFMVDDYLQLRHNHGNDHQNYADEQYWEEALIALTKNGAEYPPVYHLYQQIIQVCKQQHTTKKANSCQLCHYTIDWVGHPFTLLRLLQPIFSKGQLLVNGSPDLSRLSAFLSALLRIKKVRSDGYLTNSTLLTYMKKMSSGDIE